MIIMSVANVLIKLLITMILSRLLIPKEFGAVAAVQIVLSFAEIFWMLGVGPAIIQKKNITDNDIVTGNALNIILGLLYIALFLSFLLK